VTDADGRRIRFAPILAAIVLTVLLLWLIGTASQLLLLLFLAILLSLYLGAVADLFAKRLAIPGRWSLLLALVLTMGAVVGLFFLLVPPVVQQTQALVKVLPDYLASWEAGLARTADRFPPLKEIVGPGKNQVVQVLYEQVAGLFEDFVPKIISLVHGAISLFAVGIMGLYLALHPALYREWLIALFPPIHRDLARDVLRETADTLRAWIVGQLLAMLVLALLSAVGFYLLDVPFWLPFGLFTGLVAIVPFFGTLLSTLIPALFVLGGSGFHGLGAGMHAVLVILLGTAIHLIESNLVIPLITAKQVELPPVLTIMSVLIFGRLLGLLGLIVAVPLLAVTMVIVKRILVNRVYEGESLRRAPRDRLLILRVPAPEGGVLVPDEPLVDPISLAERSRTRHTA
jgi:predicted PurR-regulated permease PerM